MPGRDRGAMTRLFSSLVIQAAIVLSATGCPISLVGKERCATQADCLSGFECLEGRCSLHAAGDGGPEDGGGTLVGGGGGDGGGAADGEAQAVVTAYDFSSVRYALADLLERYRWFCRD